MIIVLSEKRGNEILVNKKYNRGLLWWKKIVLHKAANDPRQFGNFSCDLYKKMEMDLTNITKEGVQENETIKAISIFNSVIWIVCLKIKTSFRYL